MENQKNPSQVSSQTPSAGQPVSAPVMQSFKAPSEGPSTVKVLFVLLVMAALGVGTGYGLALFSAKPGSALNQVMNSASLQKGQTFGTADSKTDKDTAEGTLKAGGIEGEGQYHLERPGGDSQNVYLTSSSVDLSQFIGKKIKVWGATQTAQKAGWLMDVGKVEVQ